MQERYDDFEEHHRSYMKKSETNLANLEKQLKNSKISDSSSLLQRNFRHDDYLETDSRDETTDTHHESEKEINRLKEKLTWTEKNFKSKEADYESQIDGLQDELALAEKEYEVLRTECTKLKERLRNREQGILTELSGLKKDFDKQKQELIEDVEAERKNVEIRDTKISELIDQIESMTIQINELKSKRTPRRAFSDHPVKSDEVEQLRASETRLQQQNTELLESNERLKKEIELIQEYANVIQCDENMLNQLTEENETLKKKVKELTVKSNRSPDEGHGDSRKALRELQKNYMKTEEALSLAKMELSTSQREKEDYEHMIKSQNEKIRRLTDSLSRLEREIVKVKQNQSQIIDMIIEDGHSELVDKIYSMISV